MNESDNHEPQLADLRAVLALLQDGTVTRAAQRLGLSQSALSYQLERMRRRFGDPLFVRVGNRMAATPFAERLAEPAARVMRIVETEIAGLAAFDAKTTDREFRIGLNEIGAMMFLPKLARRLTEVAPHARLTPVTVDVAAIPGALESGAIDVVAGHFPNPNALLVQQLLYRREYVCVARRDHPRIGASMTLREFSATPRIETPASPMTHAWLDNELAARNLPSNVWMRTQHLSSMPLLVAHGDCIAVIPRELFELFAPITPIKAVKLPISIPPIQVHQYWHPRVGSDPAVRFFRELVFATARAMGRTRAARA